MSVTPPPGWYRDPSYPLVERWWDGTAWTDHRRQPETPQQPAPVPPPAPSPGGGPGRAKAVALATAAAVLVAAVVTGVVVLGGGDDGGAEARTTSEPTTRTGTASPSPSASESAGNDPDVVVDDLNGITLRLPDGWTEPGDLSDDDVVMTTRGTYDCPGGGGVCRHGTVTSRTVTSNDEKSPKALAEGDIPDATDHFFDNEVLDRQPYGGVTSHRLVASGPVAVAGSAGYYVRWRVETGEGPGGYVQSLAFRSSVGSQSMVIVRLAFDAGEAGPPQADMDRITKGIRPVGDADTGGGVGSSIGPSK
ncbi:DUF2510 domain-containing protein [Streptomyces sp. NPDC008313]|uniref:DUF2510 domain-containing protein n=1 Tax=Streptomyces sp. NPDC008313 TaxID=3364826 RepID=UPI0036EFA6B7